MATTVITVKVAMRVMSRTGRQKTNTLWMRTHQKFLSSRLCPRNLQDRHLKLLRFHLALQALLWLQVHLLPRTDHPLVLQWQPPQRFQFQGKLSPVLPTLPSRGAGMIVARRACPLILTLKSHSLAHCKSDSWQLLTLQQWICQGNCQTFNSAICFCNFTLPGTRWWEA